jgi:succinate dehydrogenase/fumarate reductase flavoprotein subunit
LAEQRELIAKRENATALPDNQVVRAREATAMIATARWMYNSGLERTETRGMHKRTDYPDQDPQQQRSLLCGGLDHVWVQPIVEKELALR